MFLLRFAMNTLILSDIHSNIESLRAIEKKEKNWDLLYVAGDIVDYGFFPCEVIRWLREHNAHAVAGNHDVNMLRLIDEKHQVDLNRPYTFAEYNLSLLQKDDIDYLRSLPETLEFLLDGVPCLMTHYYTPDLDIVQNETQFRVFWETHSKQYPADCENKILLFGHTHRGVICRFGNGMTWMNPGSASYRRNDDPDKDASYLVSEDGYMEIRHVPYPKEQLYRKLQDSNLTLQERRHGTFFYGPYPFYLSLEQLEKLQGGEKQV